jgi:hypothetical protein
MQMMACIRLRYLTYKLRALLWVWRRLMGKPPSAGVSAE